MLGKNVGCPAHNLLNEGIMLALLFGTLIYIIIILFKFQFIIR